MHTMSTCWALVTASIRGEMQYRFNFLIEIGFGLLWQSLGYVFVLIVIGKFDSIGGWSLSEVTLLYSIRLAGHALWALSFSRILFIDDIVQQGDYDRILLRPLPAMFQLMFGGFRVAVLGDVLGSMVLLAIAIKSVEIDWSIGKVLFLVAAIIGSGAIDGAFQLGPGALTFRFLNSNSLRGNFEYLYTQFGAYPLSIMERKARYALTFVIPLAFIAWIPGAVLLDRTAELPVPSWVAWTSPLLGVVLLILAAWFFLRESRQYQSSGS
jgi:ABC-2 type transport system permease protein